MNNTIQNDFLIFESCAYNAAPLKLNFIDEDINYFWQAKDSNKPGVEVCFPLLGFLHENKYLYNGNEYKMGIHGFANGRDFTVRERGAYFIAYELCDDEDTYRQFPWKFNLLITYLLENNKLKTMYKVENWDNKEMYFSIGGHPRYSCPLTGEESFEDYYIEFEKAKSIEQLVKSYCPEIDVDNCFFDNGKKLGLNYGIFSEGCICFSADMEKIYLKNNKNNRGLFIEGGKANYMQFWTRPGDPLIAIEPFFGAITSRPQKDIDTDWINKPGILRLMPGGTYSCAYSVMPLR